MATPASVEFNATPTPIAAVGATSAFKILTGDPIRGGFEALVGTIAVNGDLDGGTATLQVKVGGVWHDTTYVLNATVTAILLGPEAAPRASQFRFNVAGGIGSPAASLFIAARVALDFV